jgi:hypothetical protein
MMIPTSEPTPLDQWRERLGGRRRRAQPRPIAALGYLTDCSPVDGLIEVEKLTLVLLHDEPIRFGQCALRLAGHCGSRVPWGVRFGGHAHCRFAKDLMLQPVAGAQGYRIDLANEEMLLLGLQLERDLDRHLRFHKPLRDRPSLPKLWAGFPPEITAGITGDGPEMAAYAARIGTESKCLMERLRRDCQDMTLFPLAWVSHHWQQAVAIFADLTHFPKRQVFRLHERDDLAGFHDVAEFDFLSRSDVKRPGVRRRRAVLAAA